MPESSANFVPPGADVDLQDAEAVADVFNRASQANFNHPLRQGSCVRLPSRGRLVLSGDLHDHGPNFLRLVKLAQLHKSPDHHLILHEVIHGRRQVNNMDLSIRTLARVAALKLQYPDQVHVLLSNHELSQSTGRDILKGSRSVVEQFDEGLDYLYRDGAGNVRVMMRRFVRSMLLAVRTETGVFCSHSLPSPQNLEEFDTTVIDRLPTDADLKSGGSAYRMVWGRNHNRDVADRLSAAWDAKLFVMGHQPAEMGYEVEGYSMIVLASDHDRGVAATIDLAKPYDLDALVQAIIPLAGVPL